MTTDDIRKATLLLRQKYHTTGELPTNKEIGRIALMFQKRDSMGPFDIEAMAVTRGIMQGMQLMNEIIVKEPAV